MTLKAAVELYNRLTGEMKELSKLEHLLKNALPGPYADGDVKLLLTWEEMQLLLRAVGRWKAYNRERLEKDVLLNFEEDKDE